MTELSEMNLSLALAVLEELRLQPGVCLQPGSLAGEIARKAGWLTNAVKKEQQQAGRQRDRRKQAETGIHRERGSAESVSTGQPVKAEAMTPVRLARSRGCYVCKEPFRELHFFYDSLCPRCASVNYAKRSQTADCTGRVALVTGGRIKIGFQTSLKLLRTGATVLLTSRFPRDAARRYAEEADFADWQDRLQIYGVDFRHLPSLMQFARQLQEKQSHLDILINNAAQTIRRPPAFYRHLLEEEAQPLTALPAAQQNLLATTGGEGTLISPMEELPLSAWLSQWPLLETDHNADHFFPAGSYDQHGQQVDLRPENSWSQTHAEVPLAELLEVHLVNSFAPFLLLQQLRPLLARRMQAAGFVVNVSAVEGLFGAGTKTGLHPHTNMAKAGLNMLTLTCAEQYAAEGIYMNSVDTGWISQQFPQPHAESMEQQGFTLPLDEIDAAARLCDPIFTAINTGAVVYGQYLKDYRETKW